MNESKLHQYGAKMDPSEYQDQTTQPIRLAMNLLDQRINKLEEVCGRLFTALQPITSNSDEKYPTEKLAREGNSDLNCSLNKMADRLEAITVALQLQIDRLEV
jgi:predicted neuraminidase